MDKVPETPATPATPMTPAETPTTPATPATPSETAPATEVASEKCAKAATPRNTETPKSPKTQPEQEAAMPESKKYGQMKGRDAATACDLANDIAILLAKKKPFPGAATPFGSEGESSEDSEEMTEEEKAVVDSLWATRFVLAKAVSGARLGDGEKASVSDIVGAGPYAPRSGAKGTKGPFIPDKAPKSDTTDMGTSGVTDHRRNIQVGGEIKPTAPTAKSALDFTLDQLEAAKKIPADLSTFGKALGEEIVSRNTEITKSIIEMVVEKMATESARSSTEIQKSVEGLGDVVNDTARKMAAMESRISRVEKAGGVSQSGPKGKEDVAPERGRRGGVWGGLFNRAAGDALARY